MKLLTNLLLVLFFSQTFAKTIVISDIDDTIKVAHIRSKTDKLITAFKTNNIFLGMADVYEKIKLHNKDAKVFYISNAPESLMKLSHHALVSNGHFPNDGILLRTKGASETEFKHIALEKLIKEQNPSTVVLFGDNGEHDVNFYQTVASKFPEIKFVTFIRVLYDLDNKANPTDDQNGFISPFEIADVLLSEGLINKTSLDEIYSEHAPGFLADKKNKRSGHIYLPKWLSCKGFTPKFANDSKVASAQRVQDKVISICK